ncbi:MAG: sugar phosphate isomerase/epimerase family protein [Candidatus Latescibacterota bacterium]|nr:sugar phosphate isomerase/epimerase family protein [Candidatus Latescibacterota bacterium]
MAPGFEITGFADEIAPTMDEQIAGLQATGVSWVEVRGVDGVNVLDLTDSQAEKLRSRLDDTDIRVSSIGSPIGKVDVGDDLEDHFRRFGIALQRASQLGCDFVRIFSFYHKDQNPEDVRDVVLEQISRMARAAETAGIVLLHENEKGIYGDSPERCLDLLTHAKSDHFKAAFDPANFVQCGFRPGPAFDLLADHVAYFHIKDAVADTGRVAPAGHGDGDVEQILKWADERGISGFVSVEPHLKADDPEYGGTGAERFAIAVTELRKLLDRLAG